MTGSLRTLIESNPRPAGRPSAVREAKPSATPAQRARRQLAWLRPPEMSRLKNQGKAEEGQSPRARYGASPDGNSGAAAEQLEEEQPLRTPPCSVPVCRSLSPFLRRRQVPAGPDLLAAVAGVFGTPATGELLQFASPARRPRRRPCAPRRCCGHGHSDRPEIGVRDKRSSLSIRRRGRHRTACRSESPCRFALRTVPANQGSRGRWRF